MMKAKKMALLLVTGLALTTQVVCVMASEMPAVYPAAILAFHERGTGATGLGSMASDILFAELVANPDLLLVDREDLARILAEQEINLSGMVSQADAIKVGNLIGAKLLITGSVIDADRSLYLVARIIGTETSRVFGASVKGERGESLPALITALAAQVAATISERGGELVARPVTQADRLSSLRAKISDGERPSLFVSIREQHVGQVVIDPAAETEMILFAKHVGFPLLDADSASRAQADVLITGEGFSEFAVRRGNLVSVKARLEVKAVDRKTGEVLAIDRETAVVVDLTEQVAGKAALQEAAARIAERMLPKLVND